MYENSKFLIFNLFLFHFIQLKKTTFTMVDCGSIIILLLFPKINYTREIFGYKSL